MGASMLVARNWMYTMTQMRQQGHHAMRAPLCRAAAQNAGLDWGRIGDPSVAITCLVGITAA